MPIVKEFSEAAEKILDQVDHLDVHLIDAEFEMTARYLLPDPMALTRLRNRLNGWMLTKTEYSLSAPFKLVATFTRRCTHR